MATIEHFRKSSEAKLSAAQHLHGNQKYPTEVAYLCAVALECAFKARLLSKHEIKRTELIPEDHQFKELFAGRSGHDLKRLHSAVNSRESIQSNAWKRMASSERPYSLRYSTESLSKAESTEELQFTDSYLTRLREAQ